MSLYELNTIPRFTASEALLLQMMQNMAAHMQRMEMALRTNLPAAGQMLHTVDYNAFFNPHNYDFASLLREYGTSRTRQQWEVQGPFEDPAQAPVLAAQRRAELMGLIPVRLEQRVSHTPLTAMFTRQQIRRLFTKMAVDVVTAPLPSALGEGWNVVRVGTRLSAYYTYARPNRVTELVWSGEDVDTINETADPKDEFSGWSTGIQLYLPLESCWVSGSLADYVLPASREAAIKELFESAGHTRYEIKGLEEVQVWDVSQRYRDARELAKRGLIDTLRADVSDGERQDPMRYHNQRRLDWATVMIEGVEWAFHYDTDRSHIAHGDGYGNRYPLSVYGRLLDILTDPAMAPLYQILEDEREAVRQALDAERAARVAALKAAKPAPEAE